MQQQLEIRFEAKVVEVHQSVLSLAARAACHRHGGAY
jgi:hypothetical protein